jgi:glycosyltransferase involved in cell wall biosynthesis
VCNDVGDFDDYLVNNVNAFVINKDLPGSELEEILRKVYKQKELLGYLGNNLHKKVLETFSIEKVIHEYDKYF